jgi:5-methylcytosine-specific restriction protein B
MRLIGALVHCLLAPNQPATFRVVIEPPEGRLTAKLKQDFPDIEVKQPTPWVDESGYRKVEHRQPRPGIDLDFAGLADELCVDPEWLEDVRWGLSEKRSVVFYGPPGTGKTFMARRLAKAIQPDDERRIFVQLHPSYGYEEFFEGYRPTEGGSGLTLSKQSGPMRILVERALEAPDEPVVLILDEMNRGNLPKVFGELYFLLEYRNESVSLMYSPEETFSLPENLYVIGAMNTAERSIVLLDQALRRRFHFFPLFPGERPVSGMLRQYLARNGSRVPWAADLLDKINDRLGSRHIAIGPSYFMRSDLDEALIKRVWTYSILPVLEDHFFSEPGRLDDFRLEDLLAMVKPKAEGDV